MGCACLRPIRGATEMLSVVRMVMHKTCRIRRRYGRGGRPRPANCPGVALGPARMLPQLTREAAMTTLRARDLLNAEVAKVPPETPVAAIARMFADRGLSAVAVTDTAETLLGIVTEFDLIRRLADEDERPSGWLARLFDSSGAKAERYARSHGVNAGEVMTRHVVTAGPTTAPPTSPASWRNTRSAVSW